jgi:acyl dehydratase
MILAKDSCAIGEAGRMRIGHRFERRIRWGRDDIIAFAKEVGDLNPLHHDDSYAATTRFGGLIASGAQTIAYMMALCGAQASAHRPGVGLDFNFRLLDAVHPDEEVVLSWEIAAIEPSQRPKGEVVTLRGEAVGADGRSIVDASARTLFVARL